MEKKEIMKKIKIEGRLVSARYGATKFDENHNKYRIAIESDNIPYDEIHAFDKSGDRLTPVWFKERNGYINLSSIYDIPVMNSYGKRISFDDWLETETIIGSIVRVSVKQKEGALYPEAIKVIEDGEIRDPFSDL